MGLIVYKNNYTPDFSGLCLKVKVKMRLKPKGVYPFPKYLNSLSLLLHLSHLVIEFLSAFIMFIISSLNSCKVSSRPLCVSSYFDMDLSKKEIEPFCLCLDLHVCFGTSFAFFSVVMALQLGATLASFVYAFPVYTIQFIFKFIDIVFNVFNYLWHVF